MSKQRIMHGAEIDVATPEEIANLLAGQRTNVVLGLGGAPAVEELNADTPMKGTLRQCTSFERGDGSDNLIVPATTFVDVIDYDGARIAGTIINIGANPAFVYLARSQRLKNLGAQGTIQGVAVGFLAANGGSWDFKLSNDVWCGPVSVYSVVGTTIVWGTH